MIGSIDITDQRGPRSACRRAARRARRRGRAASTACRRRRRGCAELMATPQRVPPPRQPRPQMSAVKQPLRGELGREVALRRPAPPRPATCRPDRTRRSASSTALTTTIVAIVGSPRNAPRCASARARHERERRECDARRRSSTTGPPWPAASRCANTHASANSAGRRRQRSRPSHAKTSARRRRQDEGQQHERGSKLGSFAERVDDSAKRRRRSPSPRQQRRARASAQPQARA